MDWDRASLNQQDEVCCVWGEAENEDLETGISFSDQSEVSFLPTDQSEARVT